MECRRRSCSSQPRLAIVPIAALIVASTEQLSTRTGDAIGGLLNATFGNAPELIIALVALKAGLLDMVAGPRLAPSSWRFCAARSSAATVSPIGTKAFN